MKRRLWLAIPVLLLGILALLFRHEYNKVVETVSAAALAKPEDRWAGTLDGRNSRRDLTLSLSNQGPHDLYFRDFVPVQGSDFSLFNEALLSGAPLDLSPAELTGRLVRLVHEGLLPANYDAVLDRYSYDPFQALRFVGLGDSEQQSRVLALLLRGVGLDAMLFNMERHIAVAVQWDGAWHLADPTFGILFTDEENGTVPDARQLALQPDLIQRLLEQAAGRRRAAEYVSLYQWYLQQDIQARLEDAIGGIAALPPWPLPAGATVTFDLHQPGTTKGTWRWNLADAWEQADLTWLEFQGLERRLYGLGPKEPLEPGVVRLRATLPHPVTRVAVSLKGHFKGETGPLTEIYLMLPQEGAGKDALAFQGEPDLSQPLRAERSFFAPVTGTITAEIRFLPGAIFLTGVDFELDFLHGHALLPQPAGREVELQALTAPVDSQRPAAEVRVVYRWLSHGLGGAPE